MLLPSLTLIEIAERDFASPVAGVPHRRPVLESNDAHEGLPVIENAERVAIHVAGRGLKFVASTDAGYTDRRAGDLRRRPCIGRAVAAARGAANSAEDCQVFRP